jgi:hypothetical protein
MTTRETHAPWQPFRQVVLSRGMYLKRQVFMADHFRATGYMMMEWTKILINHCNAALPERSPDAGEITK